MFELHSEQNGRPGPLLSAKDFQSLQNGDMIFVKDLSPKTDKSEEAPALEEDLVDIALRKQDGWITKEKDERMCKHNNNAKCNWCMPIPPWEILNIEPFKKNGLNYLPMHAHFKQAEYLKREMTAFSEPSYAPKPHCHNHPPFPEGICTECAPQAVRLDSQKWRAVDYLAMESPQLVENIISFWRKSGEPRCGWLYGTYEVLPSIPLGIQAVVKAIYEPPQRVKSGELFLDEDPNEETVDQVARMLGMKRVGYLWLDVKTDKSLKIIDHRQNGEFWSFEIIKAAKMQNAFPNTCKKTSSGTFGSKFVSAILTGQDGNIQLFAKQISNQGMALVRDQVIVASASDPKRLKVRKVTDTRVVPDIMFVDKNEYDREVVRKAEPYFPSEFLQIPVPSGFSSSSKVTFRNNFPIENRPKEPQSLSVLKDFVQKQGSGLAAGLNDFHLLVFLAIQIKNLAVVRKIIDDMAQKEKEKDLITFFNDFLKDVPSSRPSPAPTPKPTTTTKPTTTASFKGAEHIPALVSMGFSEQNAKEALFATGGNLENAVTYLLNNS